MIDVSLYADRFADRIRFNPIYPWTRQYPASVTTAHRRLHDRILAHLRASHHRCVSCGTADYTRHGPFCLLVSCVA